MNSLLPSNMSNHVTHIAFFSSGYCTAKKSFVFPGTGPGRMPSHATWALIDHPSLGKILFDTGYSPWFYKATKHFPYRVYRWATPVCHREEDSCLSQLRKMHLAPEDISHIVVSHFHADHVCGLPDFPQAMVWCSEESLQFVRSKHKYGAVFSGVLPQLLPDDLEKRAFSPGNGLEKMKISGLDMWKWNEDIFFVDLPGHFAGQTGLYLKQTNHGSLLLCADAAWSAQAIQQKIYPAKITSRISHNYRTMIGTMNALHAFHLANPDVSLLTSHGPETLELTYHEPRV